jgi:adenine-specific DNA-methyltransferase
VRYDYPNVRYKGRYRTDRHQSPFCIKTQVEDAFREMFVRIKERECNLVLSYSNTGMIDRIDLMNIAYEIFGYDYFIHIRDISYEHSTMGRREDKSRHVKECLILAERKTLK